MLSEETWLQIESLRQKVLQFPATYLEGQVADKLDLLMIEILESAEGQIELAETAAILVTLSGMLRRGNLNAIAAIAAEAKQQLRGMEE